MRPSSGKACSRTSGVPAPLVAAGGAGSASGASASGSSAGVSAGEVGSGSSGAAVDIGCSLGAGLGAEAPVGGEWWGLEAERVEESGQQAGGEPPDKDPVGPEHWAGEVGGETTMGHGVFADDGAEREG